MSGLRKVDYCQCGEASVHTHAKLRALFCFSALRSRRTRRAGASASESDEYLRSRVHAGPVDF